MTNFCPLCAPKCPLFDLERVQVPWKSRKSTSCALLMVTFTEFIFKMSLNNMHLMLSGCCCITKSTITFSLQWHFVFPWLRYHWHSSFHRIKFEELQRFHNLIGSDSRLLQKCCFNVFHYSSDLPSVSCIDNGFHSTSGQVSFAVNVTPVLRVLINDRNV